jgi:hypothetical protein
MASPIFPPPIKAIFITCKPKYYYNTFWGCNPNLRAGDKEGFSQIFRVRFNSHPPMLQKWHFYQFLFGGRKSKRGEAHFGRVGMGNKTLGKRGKGLF